MREIKFRAWIKSGFDDDIKPFMTYNIERLHFNIGEEGIDAEDCEWDMDDIILMQYTGLYDKNGKEIYEGDIVASQIYTDDIRNLEVYYDNCAFVIDYEDSDFDNCVIGAFPGSLEVIGNIYENPELIREGRDDK